MSEHHDPPEEPRREGVFPFDDDPLLDQLPGPTAPGPSVYQRDLYYGDEPARPAPSLRPRRLGFVLAFLLLVAILLILLAYILARFVI